MESWWWSYFMPIFKSKGTRAHDHNIYYNYDNNYDNHYDPNNDKIGTSFGDFWFVQNDDFTTDESINLDMLNATRK